MRADGTCDMLRLDAAGAYEPAAANAAGVAVPPFTPAVVLRYLRPRAELSHSAALARFQAEYLPTLGRWGLGPRPAPDPKRGQAGVRAAGPDPGRAGG